MGNHAGPLNTKVKHFAFTVWTLRAVHEQLVKPSHFNPLFICDQRNAKCKNNKSNELSLCGSVEFVLGPGFYSNSLR